MLVSAGTPAARMKKVASNVVKKRSRELTSVFESFTPYNGMEGNIERIWITDIATDQVHLVTCYLCICHIRCSLETIILLVLLKIF